MDSRWLPGNIRSRHAGKYHPYLQTRINSSFNWGTVVTIRLAVGHTDTNIVEGTHAVICPTCYDYVRKEATDPDCPVCNGKGFVTVSNTNPADITVGGFDDIILTRAVIDTYW